MNFLDVEFHTHFGKKPQYFGKASGRVNLIGEHTDYNDGFVLPTAIPQETRVALAPRSDRLVNLVSQNLPGEKYEYFLGNEKKSGHWVDYVQGLTSFLAETTKISGFDLVVHSDIPIGAGLSSSAALEVAILRAFSESFGVNLDEVATSRLCQRVENEFVGAHVGIMDPMAVSVASYGTAVFLDTKSLHFEKISLPVETMELVIINSGVRHRNVGGGYNTRRQECEKACQILNVPSLREVRELSQVERLPEPLRRRVRHVVKENKRVWDAVTALRNNDMERLGTLFNESHQSMRDDYEVSIPEIDFLVDTAVKMPGVFGARLTGGGFGGSVVILSNQGIGKEIARAVCQKYFSTFKITPSVLLPIGVLLSLV